MIDDLLEELKETWSYTAEELNDIRSKMAFYAISASLDSEILKEAENNNSEFTVD